MSHFYSNWWNLISSRLTDSITLPASTALTETGAVHHVAFVVPFSKSLIYFIGQIIHNALVWWWKDISTFAQWCITSSHSLQMGERNDKSHLWVASRRCSSILHGHCPYMYSASCDQGHHGVCPIDHPHDTSHPHQRYTPPRWLMETD